MKRSSIQGAAAIACLVLGPSFATPAAAGIAAFSLPDGVFAAAMADSGVVVPALDSTSAVVVPPPASPAVVVPLEQPPRKLGVGGRTKRAASSFLSDSWVVVSSPFRARGMTLVWIGAVLGAEAVIYSNDQVIMDAALRNASSPSFGGILDVGTSLEPVGFMGKTNPFYFAALGAGYALDIRVFRTLSTEILESHFIAGGVRNIGKLVVGREHPYENHGPYVFRVGHGTSFPSGHTSVVFELATIASMNANFWPVTAAAYGAATTVALQRIQSGNHWPSDVFISAAYGTFVARTVVKLHRAREAGRESSLSLAPEFSSDGKPVGVRVTKRF